MKVSIIIPVFLGEYPRAATNREAKFKRAIDSCVNQTYSDIEIVVISDGCDRSFELMAQYAFNPKIKVYQIPKQELFSGTVRNTGLFYSTGDVICYCDADDILGLKHVESIVNGFKYNPDADWIYFDDFIIYRFNPMTREILAKAKREVSVDGGIIGTSSIAHKRLNEFSWSDCHGYGHDWTFIKKLIAKQPNPPKIQSAEYFVCHIPDSVDS